MQHGQTHRVISDQCDSLRHDPHKGIDGDDIECSIQQNRRNQSNSKDDQRTNDLCQNPLSLSLHGQKEQLLCEEGRGRGSIQLEVVAAHSSKDPQMLHEGCTQTLGQPQADQFQSAPTAHCTKRNGLHSNKVTRPHPLTRDHELGTLWLCPLYQVYIPASSQDGTPAQQSLIPRPRSVKQRPNRNKYLTSNETRPPIINKGTSSSDGHKSREDSIGYLVGIDGTGSQANLVYKERDMQR